MVAAITILETNNLKLEKQKEKEKKKKKILKELNLDPPLNPQTVFINFTQNPKKRSFLTPAEKTGRIHQYARTHMGETAAKSKKPGLRTGGGGEIVEVQGGHIVRSIGRKDRHSKVCTAKGPRDRRVRLSAPTAIQFYDVQDRLGYDRPSKAVDWLIKKAKPAIDKLRELPSWNPTGSDTTAVKSVMTNVENVNFIDDDDCKDYDNDNDNDNDNDDDSRFLPTSFDPETFADTVTSLFPTVETPPPSSSSFEFHDFPPDLSSRTNSRNQDLRLSLQSLQEPRERDHRSQNENFLLSGMEPFGGFDAAPSAVWSENTNQSAAERYRLNWNDNGGCGGEYSYNLELNSTLPLPLSSSPVLQPLFGENQLFSQRGPLQSSNIPSFRAWIDPSIAYTDNQHHMIPPATYQPSFSGLGFAPGGFSRFLFPARNSGEEEHDGISDKPSSASSNSRY